MSPETVLTIELVDARTGIVLLQSTAAVDHEASPATLEIEEGLRPLAAFFESRADPIGRLEQ